MRGKIAKKLRAHVIEINMDADPEPTEKQLRSMCRKAKTMWKRDARFKAVFSKYFITGIKPTELMDT